MMNRPLSLLLALTLLASTACADKSDFTRSAEPMSPAAFEEAKAEVAQAGDGLGDSRNERGSLDTGDVDLQTSDNTGGSGEQTRVEDKDSRMVIREATLELRADAPQAAAVEVTRAVEKAGGFVVTSDATGTGKDVTRIDVTVRVPSKKFESTLAELRQLGVVLRENITGQDVTEEFVDVTARLKAKRELESRFLSLLQTAATVEDTLRIEQELSRVRTDIERFEGRARFLQDRVSMSTIRVTATSPFQPADPDSESFSSAIGRAFSDGAGLFVDVCGGIIRVAAALLPVGIALGVLLGGLYLMARLFFRRRPRTTPTTPAASAPKDNAA